MHLGSDRRGSSRRSAREAGLGHGVRSSRMAVLHNGRSLAPACETIATAMPTGQRARIVATPQCWAQESPPVEEPIPASGHIRVQERNPEGRARRHNSGRHILDNIICNSQCASSGSAVTTPERKTPNMSTCDAPMVVGWGAMRPSNGGPPPNGVGTVNQIGFKLLLPLPRQSQRAPGLQR